MIRFIIYVLILIRNLKRNISKIEKNIEGMNFNLT